jgi:hypothetical protein
MLGYQDLKTQIILGGCARCKLRESADRRAAHL